MSGCLSVPATPALGVGWETEPRGSLGLLFSSTVPGSEGDPVSQSNSMGTDKARHQPLAFMCVHVYTDKCVHTTSTHQSNECSHAMT